jgi:hypothetical protein
MGSYIELNDTLQITTEQGFPKELDLNKHFKKQFTADDFEGKVFSFKDKPKLRLYHTSPTRVFLVHNINGKWLYWGHCLIIEQTLHSDTNTTSGKFKIIKIYDPECMKAMSKNEVKLGDEYLF